MSRERWFCLVCDRFAQLHPMALIRPGDLQRCSVAFLCQRCLAESLMELPIEDLFRRWSAIERAAARYPLMYRFFHRPLDVAIQPRGETMLSIDPKKISESLKRLVQRFDSAPDIESRKEFLIRESYLAEAKAALTAESELDAARRSYASALADFTDAHKERVALRVVLEGLERDHAKLSADAARAAEKRSANLIKARLAGTADPNEASVHEAKLDALAGAARDARAGLERLDVRIFESEKRMRDARRLACLARARIAGGLVTYLTFELQIADATQLAALRLAGERGSPLGLQVAFDDETYSAAFERVKDQLADVFAE